MKGADLTIEQLRTAMDSVIENSPLYCKKCKTRIDGTIVLGFEYPMCKCKAEIWGKTEQAKRAQKKMNEFFEYFDSDLKGKTMTFCGVPIVVSK